MSFADQFPNAVTPADVAAMTPATLLDFYKFQTYQTVRKIGEVIVTTSPFKKEPRYEIVPHFVNPLIMTAELNKFEQLQKAGGVYLAPTFNITMEVRGAGTVTINTGGGFGTIIWGDGSADDQITAAGTKSHVYAAGTFSLVIKFNLRVNTTPSLVVTGPVYSMSTLEGLTTLTTLTLNCKLATWPGLPPNVVTLNLNNNLIRNVSGLPWFLTSLSMDGNPLETIEVPGNLTTLSIKNSTFKDAFQLPPTLTSLSLQTGTMTGIAVNNFLVQLNANGKAGAYTANLSGQTPAAPPTDDGLTAKTALTGKGWTITTD